MAKKCPAHVTIYKPGEDDIMCKGVYYGDGRILCSINGRSLMVDPQEFHPEDPKRLFDADKLVWTRYRVKSVLLAVPKNR